MLLFVTAMFLHADQNLAAPNLSAIANDFQMTPMQKDGKWFQDGLNPGFKSAKSIMIDCEDSRLGGLVQFGFFLVGGALGFKQTLQLYILSI